MMTRTLALSAAAAFLFSSPVFAKNDPSDCTYFADFVTSLKAAHDAGKTKDETVAIAHAKAKADHLDRTTSDLFAGEGIGFYLDKPQYAGTAAQVHAQAYANCMNGTLP